VAGRPLSASRGVDSLSDDMTPANDGHDILINAAAAAQFGYSPRQAIGKTIIYSRSPVTVVGVLGNAKFNGALEPVRPTVYFYDIDNMYTLSIRLRGRELPATLRFIDRTARAFELDSSAQRYFLSNKVGALYLAYDTEGVMFRIFAGIAIFIACLGLFGLAAFTAGRRTKEIGIRRVFGARVGDVVWLLLWQSSIPVLIANLIAWPLAWYYLHGWLQGFAYRISLNPLYFILSGGIALLIAWATVYANTLRLARANPIHALRYE
ncbi:MAG: ABC transporter permease, partial [Steroidobacteraceae bacterium]